MNFIYSQMQDFDTPPAFQSIGSTVKNSIKHDQFSHETEFLSHLKFARNTIYAYPVRINMKQNESFEKSISEIERIR